MLNAEEERQNIARPRLPIDRVFTMTGFGTVVTGTLLDGVFRAGQEVEVLPRGIRTRVRSLANSPAHRRGRPSWQPGSIEPGECAARGPATRRRGDAARAVPADHVDRCAPLAHCTTRALPLTHNTLVDFYTGSQEVPASVRLLDTEEVRPGAERVGAATPEPSRDHGEARPLHPAHPFTQHDHRRRRGHRRAPRFHRRHQAAVLQSLEMLERGAPDELVLAALDRRREGGRRKALQGLMGYEAADIAKLQQSGAGCDAANVGDVVT